MIGLRSRTGRRFSDAALGLIVPTLLIVAWVTISRAGWGDPHIFVPLRQVLLAPGDPLVRRLTVEGLAASLQRDLLGAVAGSAAGLLFGVLMATCRGFETVFGPGFHAFRQVSIFAWIPLLTAWFGIGETTKIAFIAIAAFKPMVMNADEGIRSVPRAYLEAGRTMCLPGYARWRRLVLPAAMPSMLVGLQLAFIHAWLATIGAEMLIGFGAGVSAVLVDGREKFQMSVVLFGIVLVGGVGFLLNLLLRRVSAVLLRWREISAVTP